MSAASFVPDAGSAAGAIVTDQFVIWPHCSSSLRGRVLVVAATAVLFGCVAARAAMIGAWPQAIYIMVAVGGLALAMGSNSRSARVVQVVEFLPDTIVVRQIGPGTVERMLGSFDPGWLRVEEAQGPWEETRLVLRQSDRSITIAEFLNPEERAELAAELRRRIAGRYAPPSLQWSDRLQA